MKNYTKISKNGKKITWGLFLLKKKSSFLLFEIFKFKNFKKISGDIVEAGVFRGTSSISSALLLKKKKS